jgi:hypothetical protein
VGYGPDESLFDAIRIAMYSVSGGTEFRINRNVNVPAGPRGGGVTAGVAAGVSRGVAPGVALASGVAMGLATAEAEAVADPVGEAEGVLVADGEPSATGGGRCGRKPTTRATTRASAATVATAGANATERASGQLQRRAGA